MGCACRGFRTARNGLGDSNGDGFAGTPVACASAGAAGGVAGAAGGVAGAAGGVAGVAGGVAGAAGGVAGAAGGATGAAGVATGTEVCGVCTWATIGAATVRGCDATFMITAPAMAPATTRITMCSGFICLNHSHL